MHQRACQPRRRGICTRCPQGCKIRSGRDRIIRIFESSEFGKNSVRIQEILLDFIRNSEMSRTFNISLKILRNSEKFSSESAQNSMRSVEKSRFLPNFGTGFQKQNFHQSFQHPHFPNEPFIQEQHFFNKFSGAHCVRRSLPLGTRGRYVVVFFSPGFLELLVASARKKKTTKICENLTKLSTYY